MILFKKASDLNKWLNIQKGKGLSIGFVPTMGALHRGHISLINSSLQSSTATVCSIFVNPAQFNSSVDFEKYPLTIEKDIAMLEQSGCDVLFAPTVKEMYPEGIKKTNVYPLGNLENILEGQYRPGHFQGVCLIVHRLLEIIKPDTLYLGQKDYQQCLIITKLIEIINMQEQITIIISPTLRENDGLAMSSRNMRLNKREREKAPSIYESLAFIKNNITDYDFIKLKEQVSAKLTDAGFTTDYIEIADAVDLSVLNNIKSKQKMVALIAATIGEIRLIDNMLLN